MDFPWYVIPFVAAAIGLAVQRRKVDKDAKAIREIQMARELNGHLGSEAFRVNQGELARLQKKYPHVKGLFDGPS